MMRFIGARGNARDVHPNCRTVFCTMETNFSTLVHNVEAGKEFYYSLFLHSSSSGLLSRGFPSGPMRAGFWAMATAAETATNRTKDFIFFLPAKELQNLSFKEVSSGAKFEMHRTKFVVQTPNKCI